MSYVYRIEGSIAHAQAVSAGPWDPGLQHGGARASLIAWAVERMPMRDCDATFTSAPEELAAVLYGGAPIETLAPEGDLALAAHYVTLFPLPDKVSDPFG